MSQDSIKFIVQNQVLPYSSNYGGYHNSNEIFVNNYKLPKYSPYIFGQNSIQAAANQHKDTTTAKDVAKNLGLLTLVAAGCDFLFFKGKHIKQIVNNIDDIFKAEKGISIKSSKQTITTDVPAIASTSKSSASKVSGLQPLKTPAQETVTPKVAEAFEQTANKTISIKPQKSTDISKITETDKLSVKKSADEIVKPKAASEVKAEASIFDYGTRKVSEPLKLKTKDGNQIEYNLERRYIVEDGPFGKRVDVVYNVKDIDGKTVGSFDGMIELNKGIFNGKSIQNFGKRVGLGRTLKQYIARDAKLYKCSRIDIDAAYGSHMFHNKMGYKCDITRADYGLETSIEALNAIKKSGTMTEFESKIDYALKSKDFEYINSLLDDIFSSANAKHLKSDNLGIVGIEIPMTFIL